MSEMISVATGFQSSVNIAYDINDVSKLKTYIPTKSALQLLETTLLSTEKDSTDRARILIGAYGKGKSHIVLMILSVLAKRDIRLFEKMIPVIKRDNPNLYQLILKYYSGKDKILPVVISGSSNSLMQAFLLALQRTLDDNELTDIMPETNYRAAINTIERWEDEFPDVFKRFKKAIKESVNDFKKKLSDYDPVVYSQFENIYPDLTAGSAFNPFIGFDVAELYENVVKALKIKGYTGIYVVYDEFNKYLENHIGDATKSDTKMLQDFAEKCGRSNDLQLHLMLISHKEITSYIDRVSKSMIDGWRGVSERFHHVYLNNNFTQTYEIIAAAIEKNKSKWNVFITKNKNEFETLRDCYSHQPLFEDSTEAEIKSVVYDCYPLHPVSTFILPRLSERIAQNERTLFTFISSVGSSTLTEFLKQHNESDFSLLTPDVIYDYFEPLFKQEVYSGNLHKYYILTTSILRKLESDGLEAKIVKSIALIYILEQFEKLKPTVSELSGIYCKYGIDKVNQAIKRLVDEKFVVYLKRSNNFLRLKETSGVNIRVQIDDMIAKRSSNLDIREVLNESNVDHYLYPARYNDEKEMTRYFEVKFINSTEVESTTNWSVKRESIKADGAIFAIVPEDSDAIAQCKEMLLNSSVSADDCVFIIPNEYEEISHTIAEFDAVETLLKAVNDDPVLFDDYEVVYEDLQEVINSFIATYIRPEKRDVTYIYNGSVKHISRKAELTSLLSDICSENFGNTPVINNEVINKEVPTSMTVHSCNKIIAGLLRSDLEHDLGLSGTGQDVSIMRSTLLNTGVLRQDETSVSLTLQPEDRLLSDMLSVIVDFVHSARNGDGSSFSKLYHDLQGSDLHIGLRKGLIPIYLSVVLHEYKRELVILGKYGQVPMNVSTIEQINANPEDFKLAYVDWNPEKEAYLSELELVFGDYLSADDNGTSYERVMIAMNRWYLALPKYAKSIKNTTDENITKQDGSFLQELKKNPSAYDFVFNVIPSVFNETKIDGQLAERVSETKLHFDGALTRLKQTLMEKMRTMFCTLDSSACSKMTLTSIIRDWCEKIDSNAFEQLFNDGTDRCLAVFKAVTNDEDLFITKVAKMATDLRLEDWDHDVISVFEKNMEQYRQTAEAFKYSGKDVAADTTEGYELTYKDDKGNSVTKRFSKVEESSRGKLLHNAILSQLDSMGQAISEQEKRQVLMEVLKGMC